MSDMGDAAYAAKKSSAGGELGEVAQITGGAVEFIAGPWFTDEDARGIWCNSAKGGHTKIFDVRGWGYLTGHGHGALGLPHDRAIAIQAANATLAAAAPDLLDACRVALGWATGGMDGDWRECGHVELLRAAVMKATAVSVESADTETSAAEHLQAPSGAPIHSQANNEGRDK